MQDRQHSTQCPETLTQPIARAYRQCILDACHLGLHDFGPWMPMSAATRAEAPSVPTLDITDTDHALKFISDFRADHVAELSDYGYGKLLRVASYLKKQINQYFAEQAKEKK